MSRLLAEPRFAAAPRVALYASLPDELPTRPLFEALARAERPRLLARVCGERLEFAPVERWEELRSGPFGVLEPPAAARAEALGEADAVLVPGVGFDRRGHRLGRGRGFYDRTFAARRGAPWLFGFAYDFQVVDAIPHDSQDRAMDAIVTDRAIYWADARRGGAG